MARIRSIHPGLFTDESFMSASITARMLLIGIWTESCDDGVFEWKPITLKARIFPVDNVAVPELLAELETLDFLKRFECNGKIYGLIRNFCKWQRPKKPNNSGVLPKSLHSYCGYSVTSSEPVQNRSGTSGEKSPQMEDGGGRREDEEGNSGGSNSCPAPPPLEISDDEIQRRCEEATGWRELRNIASISKLIASGVSFEDRILPICRTVSAERKATGQGPPKSWAFVVEAAKDETRQATPAAKTVETVFVREGSPEWEALCAIKKPSLLRAMLNGKPGIYWPAADFAANVPRETGGVM